ncbi:hypothetical protein BGX20_001689, partial [Mortierella sp. AD010]
TIKWKSTLIARRTEIRGSGYTVLQPRPWELLQAFGATRDYTQDTMPTYPRRFCQPIMSGILISGHSIDVSVR